MPRKRKPGARAKSGRLSRAYKGPARDAGTPELQEKRLALVGNDADPALSATPLGCIFARGYLDHRDDGGLAKERYEKGLEFGKLHAALYQRWRGSLGPEPTDERIQELQARYNAMVDVLTDYERRVISDICGYQQWPAGPGMTLETTLEHLRSGLDAIVQMLTTSKRRSKVLTRVREIA